VTERRVVRTVDVRSAARVAFGISLSIWGIAFVGLVSLYILGLVSGGLGGVEGFIASLGFTGFRLSILPFLAIFIVGAVVASAVVGVAAGVLAHLYNSLYPLIGGVEIVVEERTEPVRPAPRTSPYPPPPVRRPDTPEGVQHPGE
jgi:hypothetical protein